MMKIAVGFIFILSKRYIIGIQYKPLHKYHKWLYPLQNKLCKIFTPPPPPTHTTTTLPVDYYTVNDKPNKV